MCNQVYDCADKSDEDFDKCYNTNCDEETQFQCGNGGCIAIDHICGEKASCLDGSDTNRFLCANDTTIDGLLEEFRGNCRQVFAGDS